LARDAFDWHARLETARIDLLYGDASKGRAELQRLAADESVPRTVRDRADEALGDEDLVRGRNDRALERYRALADRVLDEDLARTMEVKAIGAADSSARPAILSMLVGGPGRVVDPWIAALQLGEWAATSEDALPLYLVGRNLALHDEYAEAAMWLDRAIAAGGPTARIEREALRQRVVCACVLRDTPSLERLRGLVLARGSSFEGAAGRREWVLRLIARCR
jgi:hypothetical protein